MLRLRNLAPNRVVRASARGVFSVLVDDGTLVFALAQNVSSAGQYIGQNRFRISVFSKTLPSVGEMSLILIFSAYERAAGVATSNGAFFSKNVFYAKMFEYLNFPNILN